MICTMLTNIDCIEWGVGGKYDETCVTHFYTWYYFVPVCCVDAECKAEEESRCPGN